jgi:hypothetical protein
MSYKCRKSGYHSNSFAVRVNPEQLEPAPCPGLHLELATLAEIVAPRSPSTWFCE